MQRNTLAIKRLTLGPFAANAYLVRETTSGDTVIIDATWDAPVIIKKLEALDWTPRAIWTTHAHLDHIQAIPTLMARYDGLTLGLHRRDLPLYQRGGGGAMFGVDMAEGPAPDFWFEDGQQLSLGDETLAVLFVPGHAPGHVAFYHAASGTLFGGDVLFAGGIGRWDLPGASYSELMHSIRSCFMTLPDETVVLPGHGPHTKIGTERQSNPFLLGEAGNPG